MGLTAEEKQKCQTVAEDLRNGEIEIYRSLRNALHKQLPNKPDEADTILAIIFNLLPQNAQDKIGAELMIEAIRGARR